MGAIRERFGSKEALIRSAIKKIARNNGPTLRRTLRSWLEPARARGGGWQSCPLALAYGEPGQLLRDSERSGIDGPTLIREKFGLTVDEVYAVIDANDRSPETRTDLKGYFALELLAHT